MKRIILISLSFLMSLLVYAKQEDSYKSLDENDPIFFGGDYIVYQEDTIILGSNAFFIDGQFTDQEADSYPYVFNSINKAAKHLSDGTEEVPMVLYLAPFVYWVDDPDDPDVRIPKVKGGPYGLVIECEWLKFHGLSKNAENVVLACNRGQTIGSRGNFTLFKYIGQGTSSENITFGNYCNVDLEFPLKPELNRKKRASAIVQAQLIHCNGDKIVARNTRFISRLNLCPFVGGKRVLFDQCHFESTDDALCGTGIYLNSTFDFYSSKPFYWTRGTGSVFLNCDITSYTKVNQYFTKAKGQLAVVDTRFRSESLAYLGWQDTPPLEMRNYQYNVSLNEEPVSIGTKNPASTVEMNQKSILNAYRLNYKGIIVYNTYNLLCGDDDWDPMGIKEIVLLAEKENEKKYTNLPTQMVVEPTGVAIETEKDDVLLTAVVNRFGNYEFKGESIEWSVDSKFKNLVRLEVSGDKLACKVIPTNTNDETVQVIVTASSSSGLEAISVLNVAPSKLVAPQFSSMPNISSDGSGKLFVDYELDMRFEDQSLVSWYRCQDEIGSNPIKVAVSRFNKPLLEYELTTGDIGYYLMAAVEPKHIRCDKGAAVYATMKEPVTINDIKVDHGILLSDFSNFPTTNQPKVIPGFWTLDSFDPMFKGRATKISGDVDAWYYGDGKNGAKGMRGLLQDRYARLFYTPVKGQYHNMKLSMEVAPFKTAGQGFSIAPLYMDVLVDFNAETLTGYGLRFIRTTKFHNAVDCVFVKYQNGDIIEISDPISTSCYHTPCFITLEITGNKIIAHAETAAQISERSDVVKEVDMETDIIPYNNGGFGIQYAGGAPTMIKNMKVSWK